jgi:two-component system sensor histidine kinase HydH
VCPEAVAIWYSGPRMAPDPARDLTLEGLVHDLNNVFETFSDAADMLARDPKYARLAGALRRGVERGNGILGSYLDSAMAMLDFETILDSAVAFASDSLEVVRGPKIEFTRHVEEGLRLRGNPAAWERVLVNLFLNAAQAMPDGGAIEVSASREPGGTQITVADTGHGISAKILGRIFEPHFSTKAKRSGLGLHIVQSIVAGSGGTVSAANRSPGPGAVFSIRLPAAG